MRRLEDDRGSITLELCFVMPIVIGVVMMLIFITLRGLNEGIALGKSQVMVYQYSEADSRQLSLSDSLKLNSGIMLDEVSGSLTADKEAISLYVNSSDKESMYSVSGIGCKREWKLCTKRLRRWQLYGDVLCE